MTEAHLWAIAGAPFCALYSVSAAERALIGLGVADPARSAPWLGALLAAATAIAALVASSSMEAMAAALFCCGLAYLVVFDVRILAIPVAATLALGLVGALVAVLVGGVGLGVDRVWAALCAWLALRAVDLLYQFFRGRSGLGAGDALVGAVVAAWLGFDGLAWSVALGGVLSLAFAGRRSADQPLPFVPGLAAGAYAFLLADPQGWGGS